jgi:hypothetical protein
VSPGVRSTLYGGSGPQNEFRPRGAWRGLAVAGGGGRIGAGAAGRVSQGPFFAPLTLADSLEDGRDPSLVSPVMAQGSCNRTANIHKTLLRWLRLARIAWSFKELLSSLPTAYHLVMAKRPILSSSSTLRILGWLAEMAAPCHSDIFIPI